MLRTRSSHSHTQDVAQATWDINHNMNCHPAVDVNVYIDGVLTKIIPKDIEYLDANTVRVTFSNAYTGTARLV